MYQTTILNVSTATYKLAKSIAHERAGEMNEGGDGPRGGCVVGESLISEEHEGVKKQTFEHSWRGCF